MKPFYFKCQCCGNYTPEKFKKIVRVTGDNKKGAKVWWCPKCFKQANKHFADEPDKTIEEGLTSSQLGELINTGKARIK